MNAPSFTTQGNSESLEGLGEKPPEIDRDLVRREERPTGIQLGSITGLVCKDLPNLALKIKIRPMCHGRFPFFHKGVTEKSWPLCEPKTRPTRARAPHAVQRTQIEGLSRSGTRPEPSMSQREETQSNNSRPASVKP
jgi:hypothetical protein